MTNEVKKSKMDSDALAPSDAKVAFTTAEFFPDGCGVELVAGGRLFAWSQDKTDIGTEIHHAGVVYRPALLDASLEQALDMPESLSAMPSVPQLLRDIQQELCRRLGLSTGAGLLAATACLSTWVADCLAAPVVINFWGFGAVEGWILPFVSSFCRRPLSLAQPSVAALCRDLPAGLYPTIMVEEPAPTQLAQMLKVMTRPKTGVLVDGRLLRLPASLVALTAEQIAQPSIAIPLAGIVEGIRPTAQEIAELSRVFKPRLLAFRMAQHLKVASSRYSVPELSFNTAALAQSLTATLAEESQLQALVVRMLGVSDESWKVEESQQPHAIVLEALLALVHEGASVAYVKEIMEMSNAIFLGRGDDLKLNTRKVGFILRQQLGFFPERDEKGFALKLSARARVRIHSLSRSLGVLSTLTPHPTCPLCTTANMAGLPTPLDATALDDAVDSVPGSAVVEEGEAADGAPETTASESCPEEAEIHAEDVGEVAGPEGTVPPGTPGGSGLEPVPDVQMLQDIQAVAGPNSQPYITHKLLPASSDVSAGAEKEGDVA